MREYGYEDFVKKIGLGYQYLSNRLPLRAQVELTYRCNLNCVYCYCKGSENVKKELPFKAWEYILNQINREGCLWLTFSGGEPLLKDDFFEIYSFAYKKGFLISLFTNGLFLNNETISFFKKNRPLVIEITLNSISESVYDEVTNSKGNLKRIIEVIYKIIDEKLPLTLKCNGLKQNRDEILKLKAFTEKLLGKGKFKFDSFIYPRLNGDTEPCQYRLLPEEVLAIENSDLDMSKQRKKELHTPYKFKHAAGALYQCSSWWTDFFINPYGYLQFCQLSKRYSRDITKGGFKKIFYNEFPKLIDEKFTTGSKCSFCSLRKYCYFCPPRGFLETGNYDGPVEYYCKFAKVRKYQEELKG